MQLTTIETPNQQAKRMLAIRYKRDMLRKAINELDAEYNTIRETLLKETRKHKVLSLKTEDYTISRKKIRIIAINDDAKAISELQSIGVQPPMIVKLNWRAMGSKIFKLAETMENAYVKETEYISIKQNDKE